MKQSLLILLSLSTMSLPAHAVARCSAIFVSFEKTSAFAKYQSSEVFDAESTRRRIDNVIKDVNSFLGPLSVPDKPNVLLSAVELKPHSLEAVNRLALGERYGFKVKSGKMQLHNPQLSVAIYAHEYGHLVFGASMAKLEPLWGEKTKLHAQILKLQPVAQEHREREKQAMLEFFEASPEQKPALKAKADALRQEGDLLVERLAKLNKEFISAVELIDSSHMDAYNEFFADVIGVRSKSWSRTT
jgi:hypothetical protein